MIPTARMEEDTEPQTHPQP